MVLIWRERMADHRTSVIEHRPSNILSRPEIHGKPVVLFPRQSIYLQFNKKGYFKP